MHLFFDLWKTDLCNLQLSYFTVFIQLLVIGPRAGRRWTRLPWLHSHLPLFFKHLTFCNGTCVFLYSWLKGPTRCDDPAVFFWLHSTEVNHWLAAKWFRHETARWDWRWSAVKFLWQRNRMIRGWSQGDQRGRRWHRALTWSSLEHQNVNAAVGARTPGHKRGGRDS